MIVVGGERTEGLRVVGSRIYLIFGALSRRRGVSVANGVGVADEFDLAVLLRGWQGFLASRNSEASEVVGCCVALGYNENTHQVRTISEA